MSSILFQAKNVVHRVIVKFYHAFLPNAKKPYIARPVYQETLNVHEVASKAAEYNVDVSPEIIE
ncbi:MAG: hypothetical protein LBE71_04240, partial [Dysgonamonadaceae bacterium]|nr:hypothetical protein [Dysgonamonadaceae bacterium]